MHPFDRRLHLASVNTRGARCGPSLSFFFLILIPGKEFSPKIEKSMHRIVRIFNLNYYLEISIESVSNDVSMIYIYIFDKRAIDLVHGI